MFYNGPIKHLLPGRGVLRAVYTRVNGVRIFIDVITIWYVSLYRSVVMAVRHLGIAYYLNGALMCFRNTKI